MNIRFRQIHFHFGDESEDVVLECPVDFTPVKGMYVEFVKLDGTRTSHKIQAVRIILEEREVGDEEECRVYNEPVIRVDLQE